MRRGRASRAGLVAAVLGALLAGEAAGQPRPAASPGPIWLEIQATREEMDRVMAIAQRLNARLRDDGFLAEVARASAERRYDDLADMVADAAGVTPGWVEAGPGEPEVRMSGVPSPSLAAPGLFLLTRANPDGAGRRSRSRPDYGARSLGFLSPWYLRYQSRSWSWCIAVGTCPSF